MDPQDIAAAFGDFDATWNALSPRERVQALVRREPEGTVEVLQWLR